jgi:hypothetical protein
VTGAGVMVHKWLKRVARRARNDMSARRRLGAAAAQTATVVAPASMRLDLVHPAAEKITIALDRIGALNSSSFGR